MGTPSRTTVEELAKLHLERDVEGLPLLDQLSYGLRLKKLPLLADPYLQVLHQLLTCAQFPLEPNLELTPVAAPLPR